MKVSLNVYSSLKLVLSIAIKLVTTVTIKEILSKNHKYLKFKPKIC